MTVKVINIQWKWETNIILNNLTAKLLKHNAGFNLDKYKI